MSTPKPESKPAAKSQQKEPARKRRFHVVKLEERIAPSGGHATVIFSKACPGWSGGVGD
jgi:hypothetical protein